MATGDIQRWEASEFARHLAAQVKTSGSRFAFFLGAGCSISSGIPGAAELAQEWLTRLKQRATGNVDDLEVWAAGRFPGYSDADAALAYPAIMEAFLPMAKDRQFEIERIIAGKDPGFGYAVLAQLLSHDTHGASTNVVLTTNFDDLVADAMYIYTNRKPLVISHESLIGFVSVASLRPQVVKLHGDARLAPLNTELELAGLDEAVSRAVGNLIRERTLVFVGYGGNDSSIHKLLDQLKTDEPTGGVFWVASKIPDTETGEWFRKRKNRVWVQHQDFDELLLLIRQEFDLPHPTKDRFDVLWVAYDSTFSEMSQRLSERPRTEEATSLADAAERAARELGSPWAFVLEASKFMATDVTKAESVFESGVATFPRDPALLGSYANFLRTERKDLDRAEEYYQRALEADPKHANTLGNYAGFLLSRGHVERGMTLLAEADLHASDPPLLLECVFYRYVHTLNEQERDEARARIKHLLLEGVRSPGFDMRPNVERAIADGHPHRELVQALNEVIAHGRDASQLDGLDGW